MSGQKPVAETHDVYIGLGAGQEARRDLNASTCRFPEPVATATTARIPSSREAEQRSATTDLDGSSGCAPRQTIRSAPGGNWSVIT